MEFSQSMRLRAFYWAARITIGIHMCFVIVMAFNFGNLLFNVSTSRLDKSGSHWDFARVYGNIFGLVGLTVFAWLLSHTYAGINFWITGIMCFCSSILHGIFVVTYISDLSDCDGTTFCVGPNPPGTVDWAFKLQIAMAVLCGVCNVLYIPFTVYLNNRTEFANSLAIASSAQNNPNITSVLPPGYAGYAPVTGTPPYTNAPIGSDIEVGSSANEIDGPAAALPEPRRIKAIRSPLVLSSFSVGKHD